MCRFRRETGTGTVSELKCQDRVELLMTIPGIDRASARAIVIELGPDIGVFASPRHCAA